ncbi:hypothetical protein VIGAN_06197800, partial [Vigna angularis var. angularis]
PKRTLQRRHNDEYASLSVSVASKGSNDGRCLAGERCRSVKRSKLYQTMLLLTVMRLCWVVLLSRVLSNPNSDSNFEITK